jgi:hypothetical protein
VALARRRLSDKSVNCPGNLLRVLTVKGDHSSILRPAIEHFIWAIKQDFD